MNAIAGAGPDAAVLRNGMPPGGLVDWIGEAARRAPEAIAVEEFRRTLSYGELAAATARVAGALARRGVAAGDIVGVATADLCDSITAILAILRCGATFLPLDTSLPWERLARMADQAHCRVIVGHGVNLPGATTVRLADLAGGGAGITETASDDDRAGIYCLFTSGSTGQPKGVVMGQGPLCNLAAWQIGALGHDAATRFLQYAPLSFDVAFQEIFPTLAAGGTVVAREPADRRDFPALVERTDQARVTHLFLPVAALRPFALSARSLPAHLEHLRWLCVSGEQLVVDSEIHAFFLDHPQCTLVNLYGPTETNAATAHQLAASTPDWTSHVPIGLPLPGVTAYIVDETGHLAPAGEAGELYLGGSCTALGYLDEQLTRASFLPDHFSGVEGAVMYRTGDQVVQRPGGPLVFLGRRDTQTKVRGYRVELGEIEKLANDADGVQQAVAVARGEGAERELVLFLLAQRGERLDRAEIRARLASSLPPYMVPAWIFETDQIPTSRTGKIDRQSLTALADQLIPNRRAQSRADPAFDADYTDDLERELAGVWAAVLGIGKITRDRSLLDYGAHSLNIFDAFARIQEQYGIAVQATEFFRSPTIVTLAGLVRDARNNARTAG